MGGIGIVRLSGRGIGTGLDRENVRHGRADKTLIAVTDDEEALSNHVWVPQFFSV
jgi:hypothetical protein